MACLGALPHSISLLHQLIRKHRGAGSRHGAHIPRLLTLIIQGVRRFGAAAVDLCHVALGKPAAVPTRYFMQKGREHEKQH